MLRFSRPPVFIHARNRRTQRRTARFRINRQVSVSLLHKHSMIGGRGAETAAANALCCALLITCRLFERSRCFDRPAGIPSRTLS